MEAKKFADWKIRWAILNITLANLDKAQEVRPLTQDELDFKHYLKTKSLGLAAMQKARARQHLWLTWIQKGDTNTRFFQLHTNTRRKKTFISSLSGQTWTVVSQEEKSNLIHTLLPCHGGNQCKNKGHQLARARLRPTQAEIESVIKEMPTEKALTLMV
jgi:hypothetical protein